MAKTKLTMIHRLEEIPAFRSEAEEHAYWATHELSPDLWERAEPFEPDELPTPRSPAKLVAIRLDEPTLKRVKTLARRRRMNYQSLLEDLVITRLAEEEQRQTG